MYPSRHFARRTRVVGQREAVLLINTRSFKGVEWLEETKSKLSEQGVQLSTIESSNDANKLFASAKQAAGNGGLIIVGGGDGTLSGVANILAKTDSIMGVLPLGTGNAFARDLGIPTDLDKAIEVLVSGTATEVDLGVWDGGYFLNVATIGLTAQIAKSMTVPMKRRFGRFAYLIALRKALANLKPFHAKIETENGTTEVYAVQIVIGNGRFHGGPLPLSPTAAITSGSLRLYAVEAWKPMDLLRYAMLLPTGLQGVLKEVHSEACVQGVITTDPTQSIVVDGEIGAKTPLRFSTAPLALRVMAPKGFKG